MTVLVLPSWCLWWRACPLRLPRVSARTTSAFASCRNPNPTAPHPRRPTPSRQMKRWRELQCSSTCGRAPTHRPPRRVATSRKTSRRRHSAARRARHRGWPTPPCASHGREVVVVHVVVVRVLDKQKKQNFKRPVSPNAKWKKPSLTETTNQRRIPEMTGALPFLTLFSALYRHCRGSLCKRQIVAFRGG